MRKFISILSITCIFNLAFSKDNIDWSYDKDKGPANWGFLNDDYLVCAHGNTQSPINIISKDAKDGMSQLKIHYSNATNGKIINNGRTLQINYPVGNYLIYDEKRYDLLYFNFHTPAENQINGNMYPLEAQFMHKSSDGKLLILAMLFEYGNSNSGIEKILKSAPKNKNEERSIDGIKISELIGNNFNSFQFYGSLTVPPCTQDVKWIVLKNNLFLNKRQVEDMEAILGNNARPLQEVNGRRIFK